VQHAGDRDEEMNVDDEEELFGDGDLDFDMGEP
jgi:hypothetical protein